MGVNYESEICISIVLPVYNGEKKIENAIQSVLRQSYSNFELIIVDDGSSDETWNIINKYSNLKRVKAIKKCNGGVSSARNGALKYVQGDYLMFLDSDDSLVDNCLMKLVTILTTHENIDLVIYGWKEDGISNVSRRIADANCILDAETCLEKIIKTDYECGGGYPWNKLWKIRTIKDKETISEFDEKLILCEDKEWIVRQLLKCNNVMLISDILYLYNIADEDHLAKIDFNAVDRNNTQKIISFVKASICIEQTLKKIRPQTRAYSYAHEQCIQNIILGCFKAAKYENTELWNFIEPYCKKYLKSGMNFIRLKYRIMLFYIHLKLFRNEHTCAKNKWIRKEK